MTDSRLLTPLTPHSGFVRIAKMRIERTYQAVYDADWAEVKTQADQLAELARRWKDIKPPEEGAQEYRNAVAAFAEQAESLKVVSAKADEPLVKGELSRLFDAYKRLSGLEHP